MELLTGIQQQCIVEQLIANIQLEAESILFKMLQPKLIVDGNQWCCIYGELPERNCIVGFGQSPAKALNAFWLNYYKELKLTNNDNSNN
jgi:hypothetical protein